jgi:plastocyanin
MSVAPLVRRYGLLGGLLLGPLAAIAAPQVVSIVQSGRNFSVPSVTIKVGDTLRFLNKDVFLHQIFVQSPSFNFESAEQEPGKDVDVTFTRPGTFTVLCEIHPKMHLAVTVE